MSRNHVDFAGPKLKGSFYLIVVASFPQWTEMYKYRKPTFTVAVEFLNELFAIYGVLDIIISDNDTQFETN